MERYEEEAYEKRLLRNATNQLRRPELVSCFRYWRSDFEGARKAEAASALSAVETGRERVEADLRRVREQMEAMRKEAAEEKASLLAKIEELDGGRTEKERLLQEELEKEKQVGIRLQLASSVAVCLLVPPIA